MTAEKKIKETKEERSISTMWTRVLKECDQNECNCRLWPLAGGNTGGRRKKVGLNYWCHLATIYVIGSCVTCMVLPSRNGFVLLSSWQLCFSFQRPSLYTINISNSVLPLMAGKQHERYGTFLVFQRYFHMLDMPSIFGFKNCTISGRCIVLW